MADQIYLSLWFPNFRLDALPAALTAVLEQFSTVGAEPGVHAATVYPLSWSENPIFQRVYPDEQPASIAGAVAEATDPLHDDYAYEFEVRWELWVPEIVANLDPTWRREKRIVRVTGFGPEFDEAAYQQNGHLRVDLGADAPFLEDEVELDETGLKLIRQNLEKLISLTTAIEKNCKTSARMLWTESGDSLAQRLIARLQRVN